jgi:hypothetical protein
MGCITSRKKWPPDPPKRQVVRWEKRLFLEGGKWVSRVVMVTDYVVDWQALRCAGSSIRVEDHDA